MTDELAIGDNSPGPQGNERGIEDRGATHPYISVIITAYRRRRFLREAVGSVLNQTSAPSQYEIIVVKDRSDTELDTWFASRAVRVFNKNDPRVGGMLAAGIAQARGEVISFLDDDDRFKQDKLDGVANAFHRDTNLGLLRNCYDAIDAAGNPAQGWHRFRPHYQESWTMDPSRSDTSYQPWLSRYAAYANLSTLSVRKDLIWPWLRDLSRISTAQDFFIPAAAMTAGLRHRFEASRWTDYRIHPSASHATLASEGLGLDLKHIADCRETAAVLLRRPEIRGEGSLAYRLVTSFKAENEVMQFLLDQSYKMDLGEWARFPRTIIWRREKYLVRLWVDCLIRWATPSFATKEYRARRSGELFHALVGETSSDTPRASSHVPQPSLVQHS